MEEQIPVIHHKAKKKKSRFCLLIFLIITFILLIAAGYVYLEARMWFHDFAQSAKSATEQTQSSQ